MPRSFLVLQGTASSFFRCLAEALVAHGHAVHRVNFCGGDWFYGKTKRALNHGGAAADLSAWYTELVQRENITDVLMFGDCREVHRPLHPIAEQYGLRVHVFEEGYVRPHWITLERHGVNGRSRMPRDPAEYLRLRELTPAAEPGEPTGYNLYERVFHDISYRVANALLAWRFPRYRSHRPR
ncbi:MAG: capsular biosynthesis protein, partial [Paraburkholderia tropica]